MYLSDVLGIVTKIGSAVPFPVPHLSLPPPPHPPAQAVSVSLVHLHTLSPPAPRSLFLRQYRQFTYATRNGDREALPHDAGNAALMNSITKRPAFLHVTGSAVCPCCHLILHACSRAKLVMVTGYQMWDDHCVHELNEAMGLLITVWTEWDDI